LEGAVFVQWSEALSVGNVGMDSEHHELVNMLNLLHGVMMAGKGKPTVRAHIDRLIRHTETHFAHEEELMYRYAYPGRDEHTNEHRILTSQVLIEQAKFEAGPAEVLSTEVLDFLRNWLSNHILTEDARLGAYLRTKGVQ
jgi:hemerythrin